MSISAALVKELRERTGAGMMECKKALVEMNGDIDAAIEHMRKSGMAKADKKAGRAAAEGLVVIRTSADNKVATILEVNCETDFVAKTDDFIELAKNLAMHIAATSPVGITPDDVPPAVIEREKEIYRAQALETGKPEKMLDKIVEGKLNKFFKENCLMHQAYVRDPDKTIADYLNEIIAKTGEKIQIKRFARFQLGAE